MTADDEASNANGAGSNEPAPVTREVIQRRVFDDRDGWVVEEQQLRDAGEANGDAKRSYYYLEQLAVRQELDSKIAKRVAGFTLIKKDIRTMRSWVGALRDSLVEMGASEDETTTSLMPSDAALLAKITLARAVFVAIVTTYGKLYVTADGRSTSLSAKEWVDDRHRISHDYLIHLRHSFAAHAGRGAESCRVALAIDYAQSNRTRPRVFTELFQPTFVGLPELKGIDDLLSSLQARAKEALDRATEALYAEVHDTFTPEKLKFLRMGAPGTRLVR